MKTLLSTIPKLSWILSGSNPVNFLIIVSRLWFFVISRKIYETTTDFPVRFSFNRTLMPISLQQPMDLAVLREIYIEKEYAWFPIEDPKVIVDLGAHFDDTALYYHARFPNAQIIAVEPAPDSYKRLIENTKGTSQIISVQAAISDYDGEMTLNLMPSSLGNSLSLRKESTTSVQVQTMTLKTLLSRYSIDMVDLLKFDIEGAEFSAFKDFVETHNIKAFIGEVHEDLGGATIEEFKKYFPSRHIVVEQLQNKKRFIVKIN